jgi:hypothetical protein
VAARTIQTLTPAQRRDALATTGRRHGLRIRGSTMLMMTMMPMTAEMIWTLVIVVGLAGSHWAGSGVKPSRSERSLSVS